MKLYKKISFVFCCIRTKIQAFLFWLVRPQLQNEDAIRKEFILNVILVGSFVFALAAALSSISGFLVAVKNGNNPQGIPGVVLCILFIIFCLYLILRLKGCVKIVSYVFIALILAPSFYTSYKWSVWAPQPLLTYAFVIIAAGVLINAKFSLILMLLISAFIITVSIFHTAGILPVDILWISKKKFTNDGIVFSVTLFVVFIVAWLYSREIEKSLKRARKSEEALKEERDSLERRVEEKTRELKEAQLEKMMQLYKFSEFGKVAGGFLHDIINPLTVVSLSLEQIHMETCKKEESFRDFRSFLADAIISTERMKDFVDSARKQLQQQSAKIIFSVADEIESVLQIVNHKAKKEGVEIFLIANDYIEIYGSPNKFNHLITHIISNAIDSYENLDFSAEKKVEISLTTENNKLILKIKDWGIGISNENLEKIFNPFFTTKKAEKGTGIGLSICKDIIQNEFNGDIKVESRIGGRTLFTLIFPIEKQNEQTEPA